MTAGGKVIIWGDLVCSPPFDKFGVLEWVIFFVFFVLILYFLYKIIKKVNKYY